MRGMAITAVLGLALTGCGARSSGGGGPVGTTTTAAATSGTTTTGSASGWSGSYVGRYQGGGDQGLIALLVYPDGSFTGMAVSDSDPTLREVVLGAVAADGTIPPQLGMLGTTYAGSLATLQGTFDFGTFSLTRSQPDDTQGVYAGSTINETYGLGGVWCGVVDGHGQATAVFAYPTLAYVSDALRGQIDAASGDVQFSGPSDVGQGRFENGLAAGRWSARDGSQVGSWQGQKAPPGLRTAPSVGLTGSYLGRYTSTQGGADQGLVGVIVYPDRTFLAVAISEVDPSLSDVGVGVVAPDGTIPFGVAWNGTTVSGNVHRGGSYSNALSSGTFTLQRTVPGTQAGIHSGTLWNQSLSLPALWISLTDAQGTVLALAAYPTLLQLGEGVAGTLSPPAAGAAQVTLRGRLDTAQGTVENDMSAGTWVAHDGSQRGTWSGFRVP